MSRLTRSGDASLRFDPRAHVSDPVPSPDPMANWQTLQFKADDNPYETIFLGLWDLLAARAAGEGRMLVWAANTGEMCAKAKNQWVKLRWAEAAPEFITWGDLAHLGREKPHLLAKIAIVGDVDFEPGNEVRRLHSGNGLIEHGETTRFVHGLVRDKRRAWVWVHRAGWSAAFDLAELRTLRDTGQSPAVPLSDKEKFDHEQTVMSGRVGGPILIALAVGLWQSANYFWSIVAGLAGVGCTIWAYRTKLRKT